MFCGQGGCLRRGRIGSGGFHRDGIHGRNFPGSNGFRRFRRIRADTQGAAVSPFELCRPHPATWTRPRPPPRGGAVTSFPPPAGGKAREGAVLFALTELSSQRTLGSLLS